MRLFSFFLGDATAFLAVVNCDRQVYGMHITSEYPFGIQVLLEIDTLDTKELEPRDRDRPLHSRADNDTPGT